MRNSGEHRDLVVVGAGPAGRALAHRAETSGLQVALIDPAPDRGWTATYGSWADELPGWVDSKSFAAQSPQAVVYTPRRRVVDRSYVTFDTGGLQRSLPVTDDAVIGSRVMQLFDDHVVVEGNRRVKAHTIVDARGLRATDAPAQSAYGVVVDADLADRYLEAVETVLMDWRGAARGTPPSFLYAISLGGNRVLLEETCLAGIPALPIGELRNRLHTRLSGHGITAADIDDTDDEKVWFALRRQSGVPWKDRPLRFGSGGGMMHPATGYSLAASLREADTVVNALVNQQDPRRALWNRRTRAVYRLRDRGLTSLLGLDPIDVVRFFDGFFDLPVADQRAYLSSRDDLAGVARAMTRVVAHTDRAVAYKVMRGAVMRRQ
ncbi:lycopene cyclase family protein [Williamsia sp.]|uniref:lycopene cyclase family protein n=1 Tax=Williamsia sp. TaxID=1872085 RepID=UPI002F93C424